MTDVTRRMLPHLLWEIESRGRDSWGATNGFEVIKNVGPVINTFNNHREEIFSWDRAIFHTRGASTGPVNTDNQHPFTFSNAPEGSPEWKRTVVGIHNGVIANHEELNKKYSREFTCDSMHIYKHLAEGREMREICGWGNLAWYDFLPEHLEGNLRLLRFNADNLELARLTTGELVFCSTQAPIVRAALIAGSSVQTFYNIQPETIYTIEMEGEKATVYSSKKKLVFGTRYHIRCLGRVAGPPVTSWDGNRFRNTDHRNYIQTSADKQYAEGLCMRMGCTEVVVGGSRRNAVLCERCFAAILVEAAHQPAVHLLS